MADRKSWTADVTLLPASVLSTLVRTRVISCIAVMNAYLARIDLLNTAHNAIVSLRPAHALRQEAQLADEELARGAYRG